MAPMSNYYLQEKQFCLMYVSVAEIILCINSNFEACYGLYAWYITL